MTLRITQSMIFARALNDIRRSSRGIIDTQEQVASGRRINRPSDDPTAMLRLLPLSSEIRDLRNVRDNSFTAQETLDTAAAALDQGSSAMSRLRELLVQASNGTVSDGDRKTIGVEIDNLLDHVVGLANTRHGDSYLFSGIRTGTPPFRIEDAGGSSRVVYDGSHESHRLEVAPGMDTTLYSAGDKFFQEVNRGATKFSGSTGAAATSARDTGRGFGRLDVSFRGLDPASVPAGISAGVSAANSTALGVLTYSYAPGAPDTLSINGGPALAVPVSDGAFQTAGGETIFLDVASPIAPANGTFTAQADLSVDGGASTSVVDFTQGRVAVKDSHDGTVLNVDVTNLSRTGVEDVTFEGTFDVFTVLIAARDTLENRDGLSDSEVQARLQELVGAASDSHDQILTGLQEFGIRSNSMELLQGRVDGLIISNESTRSRIQDADLAESISEMTQKEFNFQASLQVSARIVQTSLLSFLR